MNNPENPVNPVLPANEYAASCPRTMPAQTSACPLPPVAKTGNPNSRFSHRVNSR